MKKSKFRKGLVLGIIVLFVGAGVIPSTIGIIEKKTAFTGSSRGYIQGLIDNSSNGDTIYIPNGTYYENIIIDKSISLVGKDKDTTIIDGGGSGDVVSVSTDWVNISGFTIRNDYDFCGIRVYSSSNNIISGNNILNNGGGIDLWDSSSNTITGNTVSSNGWNGIAVRDSSDNTITDNTVTSNNYDGISLYNYSNNNYISDNIISKNLWGIYLSFSSNNTITRNTITSNGNAGMRITDSSNNNLIMGNNFSSNFTNHGHIELLSSSFNTIKYNNFIRKLGWQVTFGYHWPKDNMCNYWNENYWNRPRIFPKPIIGSYYSILK